MSGRIGAGGGGLFAEGTKASKKKGLNRRGAVKATVVGGGKRKNRGRGWVAWLAKTRGPPGSHGYQTWWGRGGRGRGESTTCFKGPKKPCTPSAGWGSKKQKGSRQPLRGNKTHKAEAIPDQKKESRQDGPAQRNLAERVSGGVGGEGATRPGLDEEAGTRRSDPLGRKKKSLRGGDSTQPANKEPRKKGGGGGWGGVEKGGRLAGKRERRALRALERGRT